MARTPASRSALALAALLLAIAGCREELTTPGRCPALCPASDVQMADTLLTSPVVWDTSVRGYVAVREAAFLLSSSLDSLKSVMLIRFASLPTKWYVNSADTVGIQVGHVDSVRLLLRVGQRDTAAKQLRLVFYRLPAQFDTTSGYARMQPYFADSCLVDSVLVDDTIQTGAVSLPLPSNLAALPGDSGVISLGVAVVATLPTAFAVGSGNLGSVAPSLEYYVRGQPPQDTVAHALAVGPDYATFVMSPDPGLAPNGVLTVGGIPSARAAMRLALPKVVTDSIAIVRGTLILSTARPAIGFARDSFYIEARPLLRDYGIKSMLYPDSLVSGHTQLHQGQGGSVEVDITAILRLWGTTTGDTLPRSIVLRSFPEGQVLGSVDFKGHAAGAAAPELRVTYVRRYTFGVP